MDTEISQEPTAQDGHGPETGAQGGHAPIRLSLVEIHKVVPTLFRAPPGGDHASMEVPVHVDELRGQMMRGRVTVSLEALLREVPEDLLCKEGRQHLSKHVVLPLDMVFPRIDPLMLDVTGSASDEPALDDLPDVFAMGKDQAAPAAETGDVPPAPVPAPAPVAPEAAPHPEPAVPAPVPPAAPAAPDVPAPGEAIALKLSGIDVNRASAEDLARRLDGVGPSLARRIAENRRVFGAFLSLHDLARVPGVGPRAFERITGLRWRADANAQREKVLDVLHISDEGQISVEEVARRFASLPGYDGCIMTTTDGELLAASWQHQSEKALGAFAPQFIKKLTPYIQSLGIGEIDLMTLFISERPFTLIQYESLVFVAVHQLNRFSRRQLRIAQQVVQMLGRLMFRR